MTEPNPDVIPPDVLKAAGQVLGAQFGGDGRPSPAILELKPGVQMPPNLQAEGLQRMADIHDTGNLPILEEVTHDPPSVP